MTERPERQHDRPQRPGPRFTVIVPTFDRPEPLAACVRALLALERPGGTLEIVIVNDGGRPPSAEVMRSADGEPGLELHVVEQRNAGPAAARNAGAAAARGEWLAFTDDDCLPDPRWLSAFDAALRATPAALVGGRTVNAFPDSVFADTSQSVVDFAASYFDGGATGRFFTANNLAVARDAFLAAGGFDARFAICAGEDREFSDRWSAQGRPSVAAPDALVRHAHRLSLRSFVRQHFTYGRGAVTFRRLRAESGRPVRVDPAFYARSLAYAIRGGGLRAPMRAMATALAHAAYAAGLFWESRRRVSREPAR